MSAVNLDIKSKPIPLIMSVDIKIHIDIPDVEIPFFSVFLPELKPKPVRIDGLDDITALYAVNDGRIVFFHDVWAF